MASKREQRKQAKKKKRKATKKKEKLQQEAARTKTRQFRNAVHKGNNDAYKAMDKLEGEILLEAIGLPIDNISRSKAVAFISSCKSISDNDNFLSIAIDDLFSVAHEVDLPGKYRGMNNMQILGSIVKKMKAILRDYETNAELLLDTEIGRKVYTTDDLGNKITALAESRRDELIEIDGKFKMSLDFRDPEEEEYDDDDITVTVAADGLASSVTNPIEHIERFRLGVPRDFFHDVISVISEVNAGSAIFYLRELYNCMQEKDFPMKGLRDEPLIKFSAVLNIMPDKLLPDPEYLQELKEAALRFDDTGGGIAHFRTLLLLCDSGLTTEEAMAKLERLPDHSATPAVLRHLNTEEMSTLDKFLDYPEFFDAYKVIHKMGKSPGETITFLRDYGDYQINGSTIAGVVRENQGNRALIELIFNNALYLCCDEASADMIEAIKDVEKGAWALRHYIRFGESEEPFKQLALLRYVRERDTQQIRDYIRKLDRYEDEVVGELLPEAECINMVLTGYKPVCTDPTHRFKEMDSFDLVMQYNMAPDLDQLSQSQLKQFDEFISTIRGTKCENVLLGQPSLRRRALERLLNGGLSLDNLPEDGNIYLILRDRLTMPEETKPALTYDRIVLISDRSDQRTVVYLQEETGCEVNLLSVTASPHRFDGIREGDIVLYDTTKTSHSTYYLVKNLTVRRGAEFRHISRINKDALLGLLQ